MTLCSVEHENFFVSMLLGYQLSSNMCSCALYKKVIHVWNDIRMDRKCLFVSPKILFSLDVYPTAVFL